MLFDSDEMDYIDMDEDSQQKEEQLRSNTQSSLSNNETNLLEIDSFRVESDANYLDEQVLKTKRKRHISDNFGQPDGEMSRKQRKSEKLEDERSTIPET